MLFFLLNYYTPFFFFIARLYLFYFLLSYCYLYYCSIFDFYSTLDSYRIHIGAFFSSLSQSAKTCLMAYIGLLAVALRRFN